MQDITNDSSSQQSTISLAFLCISQRYQKCLDDITPFPVARWTLASVLYGLFMLRIILLQGWYIVACVLVICHLSYFLAFLTPIKDPEIRRFEDKILFCVLYDYQCPSNVRPTQANEEFRPFIRNLPEFKFWYFVIKSTLLSFVFTFFKLFDFVDYGPILILYFVVIFYIAIKRQVMHMIRYKYLPFTHSKPKYQSREDSRKLSVPVVSQV